MTATPALQWHLTVPENFPPWCSFSRISFHSYMLTRHQHNFTDLRIQYWSQYQGTHLQVQHHGSRGRGFPSSSSSWRHSKALSPNQGLWMWLTWRLLGLEPSPGGKHQIGLCVRGRPCHMGQLLWFWRVFSIPQGPHSSCLQISVSVCPQHGSLLELNS